MKRKLLLILTLLLLIGVLASCGRPYSAGPVILEHPPLTEPTETPSEAAPRYTRITQWDYHHTYSLLLTSVEEQGDSLLLRGVLANWTLASEEVEAIRVNGAAEINGETFTHTICDDPRYAVTDRLYNAHTGMEISLVPMEFGPNGYYGGGDIRYILSIPAPEETWAVTMRETTELDRRTELYLEIEVDKATRVFLGWTPDGSELRWGVSVDVFDNLPQYSTPDGFIFRGYVDFFTEGDENIVNFWPPTCVTFERVGN